MNYYDTFLALNSFSNNKWNQDMQELVNMQFYDSDTYETGIEEEDEFGTLQFHPIIARLTTLIDVKTGQRNGDNYRKIIFQDCSHRPKEGTRYRFDDNIWIIFAIKNLKTSTSSAYLRRCNNTLNTQDKYGNIHREPCYIDYRINETQLKSGDVIEVPSGRLDVYCQLNKWTKDIDVNQRYIFGDDCYKVRYRAKYDRGITFDNDSATVLQFYVNYDNKAPDDNFELQVANYKEYDYSIKTDDSLKVVMGQTGKILATTMLNGCAVDEQLVYESEDDSAIYIDQSGNYSVLGLRNVILNDIKDNKMSEINEESLDDIFHDNVVNITVYMKDKPDISSQIAMTIEQQEQDDDETYVYPDIKTIKLNNTVTYQIMNKQNLDIIIETEVPDKNYKFEILDDNKFCVRNLKQSKDKLNIVYSLKGSVLGTYSITLGGIL